MPFLSGSEQIYLIFAQELGFGQYTSPIGVSEKAL